MTVAYAPRETEREETRNERVQFYVMTVTQHGLWVRQHKRPAAVNLPPSRKAITPHEIVNWFKVEGLPIAAIADMVRVERKSVYSWLNGVFDVSPAKQIRLEMLHGLLSENKQASLKELYRLWRKPTRNGAILGELLKEEDLDSRAINQALIELWPLAKRYQAQHASRPSSGDAIQRNPILSDVREVTLSDES